MTKQFSDELKATVLNVSAELVLECYVERTNLGTAEEKLKTLTDAVIKTYQKLLGETDTYTV